MRRTMLLPAAMLALAALSGCGGKARNEAAEANETVAGDSNTMAEAVNDVDAAQNEAAAIGDNMAADNQAMSADEPEQGEMDGNEITD
jgi:hypothetical protein